MNEYLTVILDIAIFFGLFLLLCLVFTRFLSDGDSGCMIPAGGLLAVLLTWLILRLGFGWWTDERWTGKKTSHEIPKEEKFVPAASPSSDREPKWRLDK